MDYNTSLSNFIVLRFVAGSEIPRGNKYVSVCAPFYPHVFTNFFKENFALRAKDIGTKSNKKFFLKWSNILSK